MGVENEGGIGHDDFENRICGSAMRSFGIYLHITSHQVDGSGHWQKIGARNMTKSNKGLFITMEGPDGSGKSTQMNLLCEYLREQGVDFLQTREPGGTAIGEKIRNLVLDKSHPEMDDLTEAMLYAAARAQHVAEVIRPALAQGQLVVCDRFMDSSLVYQGYARGLGDPVTVMNQLAVGDCLPDVTFLVLVDPKTGMNRIQHKDRDRLEQLDETFHQKVYEGYIQLWEQSPNRIHRINGNRAQERVFEDIKDIIGPMLAKR